MGAGLRDLDQRRADVTLGVRDHGPADPATVNQQLHTFDAAPPGCTGWQMSVHQAS
jgi:hypothetical protein